MCYQICDEGFCEKEYYCNFTLMSETSVCNHHGNCVRPDECSCWYGYFGEFCDKWVLSPIFEKHDSDVIHLREEFGDSLDLVSQIHIKDVETIALEVNNLRLNVTEVAKDHEMNIQYTILLISEIRSLIFNLSKDHKSDFIDIIELIASLRNKITKLTKDHSSDFMDISKAVANIRINVTKLANDHKSDIVQLIKDFDLELENAVAAQDIEIANVKEKIEQNKLQEWLNLTKTKHILEMEMENTHEKIQNDVTLVNNSLIRETNLLSSNIKQLETKVNEENNQIKEIHSKEVEEVKEIIENRYSELNSSFVHETNLLEKKLNDENYQIKETHLKDITEVKQVVETHYNELNNSLIHETNVLEKKMAEENNQIKEMHSKDIKEVKEVVETHYNELDMAVKRGNKEVSQNISSLENNVEILQKENSRLREMLEKYSKRMETEIEGLKKNNTKMSSMIVSDADRIGTDVGISLGAAIIVASIILIVMLIILVLVSCCIKQGRAKKEDNLQIDNKNELLRRNQNTFIGSSNEKERFEIEIFEEYLIFGERKIEYSSISALKRGHKQFAIEVNGIEREFLFKAF